MTTRNDQTALVSADDLIITWLSELDTTADTKRAYRLGLSKFVQWVDGGQATPVPEYAPVAWLR